MRSMKVLPLAAVALALACSNDVSDPNALNPGSPNFLAVSGAAFTTTNTNDPPLGDGTGHCKNGNEAVNCNIYDGKDFVWLSGGPVAAALGDGEYFFAVLAPGGQGGNENPNDGTPNNLSDVSPTTNTGAGDAFTNRVFTLTAGVISYSGTHDFDNNKIRLMPYDDTPNPGGVYILAICAMPHPATPSSCKYDAFKVNEGGGGGEQGNPELSGLKYYDANQNGRYDAGEEGIEGWLIDVTNHGTIATGTGGTFDITVSIGQHVLTEQQPGNGWSQTGNTVDQTFTFLNSVSLSNFVYTVGAVGDGVTIGLNFGNVCNQVTPGGHTMGFWSNKNGQGLINSADLTALNNFNLANATGNQGNFANKGAYRTWLLSATATNMAYMLSAQMSATYLSVQHGFTNGNAVVDYFDSAYDGGYPAPRTVNDEIQYANYLLSLGQVTKVASALRTEQERVKNILDSVNNGNSFIVPNLTQALEICGTPFPIN